MPMVKNNKFGTFGGVFVPSILTIFGLVMFMRTGAVIGSLGISGALVILLLAESIAIATGLSISAISTNTAVQSGGAYFLISRALGPSFGGAIGICLFLSQTISIPFYILGFSDSVIALFPDLQHYALYLNLAPLVIMFGIALTSTDLAIKTQYFIFAIMMLAIAAFLGGAIFTIVKNGPILTNISPSAPIQRQIFFFNFAVFFPAVTGFLSGVSMSGDLKEPSQALPRGTMSAIIFGLLIYAAQIILTGLAFPFANLLNSPFNTLVNNAVFHTGFLVIAGVMVATLSSALGSLLGAPRTLQALAKDKIFRPLRTFSAGRGKNREPVRAMILSFGIAAAILIWASNQDATSVTSAFNPINIMAGVVAMFSLFTYALINLAAFVESFGANPSFRPKFHIFSWHVAIYGVIACIAVAVMIDFPIALLSTFILAGLYFISRRNAMTIHFGDARRGFLFSQIRTFLLDLQRMPEDSKNWRPRIAVMVDSIRHSQLIIWADLLNNQRGLISTVSIVPNDNRQNTFQQLQNFSRQKNVTFFPSVIGSSNMDDALTLYLQSLQGNTPIAPNTILCGWPSDNTRFTPFLNHLNTICELNFNCIIATNIQQTIPNTGTIDIWWRGQKNGSLMLILAYLLQCNPEFRSHSIRLLRITSSQEDSAAKHEMKKLIENARINAEIRLLPDSISFNLSFRKNSQYASAIFLGFLPMTPDSFNSFATRQTALLEDMPPTFLVYSNGQADLNK